jgi:HNH endonuclease
MSHFARTKPAPLVTGGYRGFRTYVRADFCQKCAYCLIAELWAAGEQHFELDHFRPKSLFPELEQDFYNLYYACHPCNLSKHRFWPPEDLEQRGTTFVDLCQDEFESHFRSNEDGTWSGITESGKYTVDILRLNKKHLVQVRLLLRRLGIDILSKISNAEDNAVSS